MVGIYIRISGKKEEDKDTSEFTQEQRGIAFANKMGMRFRTYKDIGISGTTGEEKRDGYKKLIKDIASKQVTHIYAYNQSRIERNPDVWRIFVSTVLNAGAKWYPSGVEYNLDNNTNRMMAGMLSLFNEFHATNTSEAVRDAFNKNARDGKGHGLRAYGIDYDEKGFMIQNPEEMSVVKQMFKWSLEGMGVYSIANKLNDMDVPTRYKKIDLSPIMTESYTGRKYSNSTKKWWGSTVSGILKKELYKGYYIWGDERVYLPHLAAISEEDFDAVQQNFAKNKKNSVGKNHKYQYLLNGLVYCSECGSMFRGVIKVKSRDYSYKCKGKAIPTQICKSSRSFNISRIETFILKHLFLSKGLQERLNATEVDNDEKELQEIKVLQLKKKVSTQSKMVTKARNLLYEDFKDDLDIKNDYIHAKKKLSSLKEIFKIESEKLNDLKDNNRLNRINDIIDGFDLSAGFDVIKASVHNIIERIDVSYTPLEKNGVYRFIIKYRGFNECSMWSTNQQLTEYTLVGYESPTESPDFFIPEGFQKYIDNHPSMEFLEKIISNLKTKEPQHSNMGNTVWGNLDVITLDNSDFIKFN